MDIAKFYESLSPGDKKKLKEIIYSSDYKEKEERRKEKEILIKKRIDEYRKNRKPGLILVKDFVNRFPLSARLRYALLSNLDYFEYKNETPLDYIDDYTKKKFFRTRNVGEKSWNELLNIINNSLKGTEFEHLEEQLKKYFNEQDKSYKYKPLLPG